MIHGLVGEQIWFLGLISRIESVNVFALVGVYIGVCAIGYLLGSVNTAILVSKLVYHEDIRNHGSGNAGMTNMMRTYGKGPAAITFIGDLLKTLIAMTIGTLAVGINGAHFAGLFAVLGHIAPIYHKFKGGKGVTAGGMFILYLDPWAFLAILAIFILVVWGIKYLSLGSIIVAFIFPYLMFTLNGARAAAFMDDNPGLEVNPYLTDRPLHLLIMLIISFVVIFMHRANIKRLASGTESKFSFKKTKKVSKVETENAASAAEVVTPRSLHNIDSDDDGTDEDEDDSDEDTEG